MRKRQRKKNQKNAFRNYIRTLKKKKILRRFADIPRGTTIELLQAGEIAHYESCRLIVCTPEEHRRLHMPRLPGKASLRGMVKRAATFDDSSYLKVGEVTHFTIGGRKMGPGILYVQEKKDESCGHTSATGSEGSTANSERSSDAIE